MAHFKVLYQSLPTGRDKKYEQSYSSLTKFKTSQKLVRVLNPLMPNLNYIVFKNSLLISKKHQHGSITKINWLMLFTDYVTGWYYTKCPMHCGHFLTYCASLSKY
jgi:hypothetical protein